MRNTVAPAPRCGYQAGRNMSRRLIHVGALVSHASGSDYTKEVDGTAKLQNKKWVTADRKPGRNDETEVAVTERCVARTLSDQ